MPADSSFRDQRPYDWVLGQPDSRIRPGFDEGALGMREGEWRRLIVPGPLAYGDEGLLRGGGPRNGAVPLIAPMESVYVDVLTMEADKCDDVLRPDTKAGRATFAHDANQKSLLCKRKGAPPRKKAHGTGPEA